MRMASPDVRLRFREMPLLDQNLLQGNVSLIKPRIEPRAR